jgi:hypothetical protein
VSDPNSISVALFRRSLGKLWPFLLDNGPHLVGNSIDQLDFEHLLMQPVKVVLHHDLDADDARPIHAQWSVYWSLSLPPITSAGALLKLGALLLLFGLKTRCGGM